MGKIVINRVVINGEEYTKLSADVVERKSGEWCGKHKMPDMPRYKFYKCSECGFLSQSVVNYCPRCGADMRGKER